MFCRIYISRRDINKRDLLNTVCDLLEVQLVQEKYIECDGFSIEVRSNNEYDKVKEREFPDGFLYFPFSIEIDMQDGIKSDEAAKQVSRILLALWARNFTAIASCEFENLLPEKGGYRSKNIPWIAE